MSSHVVLWLVTLSAAAAIAAVLAWVVRRIVVLFAMLEAQEKLDDNAPRAGRRA